MPPQIRLKNFRTFLKGDLISSLSSSFLARGIVAIGSVIMMTVLARLYGAGVVGAFALAQNITVGTGGMLSRTGMDIALMRFVSKYRRSPEIIMYLRWACQKALVVSFIVSFLIFVCRKYIGDFFSSPQLNDALIGTAAAVPFFTLAYIMAGFFKGIRRPAEAILLENGMVSLVAGLIVLLCHYGFEIQGIYMVGWAYAGAAWIVMLYGAGRLLKWFKQESWEGEQNEPNVSKREFMDSSNNFFALNLTNYLQNRFDIVVAGFLLGSRELGLYRGAQQMGTLIKFILIVINAVFPPRFASLHHEGKFHALQKLARQSSLIGIVIALPFLLMCLIFPEWILGLLGKEFPEAAPLLRIIATAQMINVASGSVGFLLNMTGHERLTRNIAVTNSILGIGLYLLLIPTLGALGAAISLSLVLVLQNLVALVYVWKRLGIWVLPIPNILKIFRIPQSNNN